MKKSNNLIYLSRSGRIKILIKKDKNSSYEQYKNVHLKKKTRC